MLDKILQVTLKRIEMKTVSSQRNKILLLEEDFKKQEKRCILRPTEVTIVSQCEGILRHILRTIDANTIYENIIYCYGERNLSTV